MPAARCYAKTTGGRPGRLLAYFDDISASAVSPPLPLLLLLLLRLSLLRFSVSRAFALSALITARFVPLSTARPRLETKLFRNVGRR